MRLFPHSFAQAPDRNRKTTKTTIKLGPLPIALKWFPAHMGRQLAPDIKNRNEEADAAARGLITCRTAAVRPSETSGEDRKEDFEPLTDYELPRAEAVKFRQLQTECVLTPALARHVCPDMFVDAKCSVCERELATLRHIMHPSTCRLVGAHHPRGLGSEIIGL
ncbi:hypothetical protein HPB50_028762 [Hyalomma asiaticum]|nr:hypothetical protein HPB50_028762 [Hyalomma asiaticum]